jgi:hypothetical protein
MWNFCGETSWKMSVWKTEEEIGWEVDGSVSVLCWMANFYISRSQARKRVTIHRVCHLKVTVGPVIPDEQRPKFCGASADICYGVFRIPSRFEILKFTTFRKIMRSFLHGRFKTASSERHKIEWILNKGQKVPPKRRFFYHLTQFYQEDVTVHTDWSKNAKSPTVVRTPYSIGQRFVSWPEKPTIQAAVTARKCKNRALKLTTVTFLSFLLLLISYWALKKHWHSREDIIKMDLKEIGREGAYWVHMA